MSIKKLLALILSLNIVMPASSVFAADTNTFRMVIDDSNVFREIGPEMYGTNMEWAVGISDTSQRRNEKGEIVVKESFAEKYGDLLKFTRKAGTSANYFLWKDALGDLNERKNQKIWGVTDKVYEGVVEWLKSLYMGTDSPKITYVVNIYSDTYENIADVVEFMTGDGTINYNGGVNWAEQRIKMGFEKPIDVYTWEIGNELDWSSCKIPLEDYLDRSEKAINVIKSIDPDAKICMHASTAVWDGIEGSDEWHRGILKRFGDRIDYISIHYYYPVNFIRRADPPIETLKKDIVEITGSDRIKLYYSEQAPTRTVEKFTKDDNYAYCLPHTIWGATAQAEFYLRKMLDPWVVATTCHSTDSANWSISYTDENGECQLTATGETMKTFMKYAVGKMFDCSLDTFGADKDSPIAGGAVEDEDGNVNIIFVNRNEKEDVTVNFEFKENLYKLKHVRQVHGDVKTADNWYRAGKSWEYDNPDRIEVTDEDINSSEEFSSYTFEPLSVYALQLEKERVENYSEVINEHINNSFAFGYDYSNYINKGQVLHNNLEHSLSPKLYNGLTYLTLEMMKAIFGQDIEISHNGNVIICSVLGESFEFDLENNSVNIDNMPTAQTIDGEIYLPFKAIAEKAGYSVVWDDRAFIIVYKNGTLNIPNSSLVRNAIYEKLIGG